VRPDSDSLIYGSTESCSILPCAATGSGPASFQEKWPIVSRMRPQPEVRVPGSTRDTSSPTGAVISSVLRAAPAEAPPLLANPKAKLAVGR